jgi:hypothetical protein
MTQSVDAPSKEASAAPDARRNFILQQGLCDPAMGTCRPLYAALLFQPWVVGTWVLVATIFQSPRAFLALTAVLWWSAAAPRWNPFDALHNLIFARSRVRGERATLTPAPPPRRFAQVMAGTFALTIALSLLYGWRMTAYVIEGCFLAAIALLLFGGLCFGSFVFHMLRGRSAFARRTLPWASGE